MVLLEDSKLIRQFGEELDLDDDKNESEEDKTDPHNQKSLFSLVSSSEWINRSKRTWYTPKYLSVLKELLQLYPWSHQKIRQILKIPKSSFWRLKQEISRPDSKGKWSRRFMRSHPELSKEEQILISKIVEPPTEPMTIDKI